MSSITVEKSDDRVTSNMEVTLGEKSADNAFFTEKVSGNKVRITALEDFELQLGNKVYLLRRGESKVFGKEDL